MEVKMDYSFDDMREHYDLKEEIMDMNLENVYQSYMRKIKRNYLGTFTIVHLVIAIVHSLVIIFLHEDGKETYDVYFYIIGAILTCLSIRPFMSEKYAKSHRGVPFIVSWIAGFTMALTDILSGMFYEYKFHDFLRLTYSGYVLTVIYFFMPLSGYFHPFMLAFCVTILYSIDIFSEAILSTDAVVKKSLSIILPDFLYLVALNVVGLYICRRQEIATRSVFLSKRQRLEQTLYWKNAKDQRKGLLDNIIPAQIAKSLTREIEQRIAKTFEGTRGSKDEKLGGKIFIETHTDVTIIFADIVNYTFLTTRVDVKTLVETLHELFQKFDQACQEYNIMPIKFLGDCYYAVSGIPTSHPLHSVCCIEFGLSIITHIRNVRAIKHLDINMRIGIHSGSLLGGIIGASKWQYDVWSIDVDIANRLEATGMPGRLHVSNTTLRLAQDFYVYENGTEKATLDPVLIKNNVRTFLIIGKSDTMLKSQDWQNYRKMNEEAHNREKTKSVLVVSYQDIISDANNAMEAEVDKLPICKFQFINTCFGKRQVVSYDEIREHLACDGSISSVFLQFNDLSTELNYLTSQPRSVYVLPVMATSIVLICTILSQAVQDYIQDIITFWLISVFMIGLNIAILVTLIMTDKKRDWVMKRLLLPYAHSLLSLSGIDILKILIYHALIYSLNMATILIMIYVHVMLCDSSVLENDFEIMMQLVEEGKRTFCFNSWVVTQGVCVFLALTFAWPRTPFLFSITISLSIVIFNVVTIFSIYSIDYESSIQTNVGLSAEFTHVWSLLIMWYLYWLIGRHITYVSKNNYYNLRQLESEIQESKTTSASIKVLLLNMLPAHVVDAYLKHRVSHEPYYEYHRYVAVMFATVLPDESITMDLSLMNDIICNFDDVLSMYRSPLKVEKIKIVNGTYMAACGLSVDSTGRSSVFLSTKKGLVDIRSHRFLRRIANADIHNFGILGRSTSVSERSEDSDNASWISEQWDTDSDDKKQTVVYRMASFALDLLKTVQKLNARLKEQRGLKNTPLSLRVGISSGEVAAGIVGYTTSHYDIWGNAVNMASRMDSTGVSNRIQVCEQTANILAAYDIVCSYRGMTYIKSLGELPTYFIEIDKLLNFIYKNEENGV